MIFKGAERSSGITGVCLYKRLMSVGEKTM